MKVLIWVCRLIPMSMSYFIWTSLNFRLLFCLRQTLYLIILVCSPSNTMGMFFSFVLKKNGRYVILKD